MIYESAEDRAFDYKNNKSDPTRMFRTATVAYMTDLDGYPLIVFSGEKAPSGKQYRSLNSYKPKFGDHILLARVNGTYVILGKVGDVLQ